MRNKFIHCAFEDQAALHPGRVALIQGNESLSYNDLNQAANRLAHLLVRCRAGREAIGLLFSSKQAYITALLASLKAGAISLPLNAAAPASYLGKQLRAAQPFMIITDPLNSHLLESSGLLNDFKGWVIVVDENRAVSCRHCVNGSFGETEAVPDGAYDNPELTASPDEGCYRFFVSTPSGQEQLTGKYKSLAHAVVWLRKNVTCDHLPRVSFLSGIHTEASLRELFLALSGGGALCIPNEEKAGSLLRWLRTSGVTTTCLTASQFRNLVSELALIKDAGEQADALQKLQYIFITGESLYSKETGAWFSMAGDGVKLFNLYTLPEITLHKLIFPILPSAFGPHSASKKIPVGKPIGNAVEIILNSEHALCGPGETGELYIKTPFLPAGYSNDAARHKAFFMQNPIHSEYDDPVCRTGHLAMYDKNGDIELAGCADEQLNLHGTRIYPNEIEDVLKKFKGIKDAVVFIKKDAAGDKTLAAALVSEKDVNPSELTAYLSGLLPPALIPAQFNSADSIALLPSGSADRSIYHHRSAGQVSSLAGPAKISRQERPEFIPLSFGQQRLWFLDRLQGSIQYHIPLGIRLKGNLDPEALEFALQTIINRHEVLRTVIKDKEGVPYQQVKDKNKWRLARVNKQAFENDTTLLHQYIREAISRPFDLSKDYTMRVELIGIDKSNHVLLLVLHHIASDSWSRLLLESELIELYRSYTEQRAAVLPALPVQYADYAIWQRNYLRSESVVKKLGYWKKQLKNVTPLSLPADFTRSLSATGGSASVFLQLDQPLSQHLQQFSQRQSVTLFITMLTAFKVLCYRYSGQEDICIGTAMWEGQNEQLKGLIGSFINMLALRSDLQGNPRFSDLLQSVKNTSLDAYEHQEIPFEKVVEEVVDQRNLNRTPLFQVLFGMQHEEDHVYEVQLGEMALLNEPIEGVESLAGFELNVSVWPTKKGLKVLAQFDSGLYKPETVARMLDHYHELLKSVLSNKDEVIGKLPMLTEKERVVLTSTFNDTQVDYPTGKTVVELFGGQVEKTPADIAVIFEAERLSYKELDARSNQLCHYLRSQGVKAGSLVPLCIERGCNMIVAILGILKSGGAYVPIDPEYPEERISYMLNDTGAELVLSSTACKGSLKAEEGRRILVLDEETEIISREPDTRLKEQIDPASLAYVIYTSGSTGRPKGVMIEHKGLLNRLLWAQHYFKLGKDDAVLQKTNYCFDVSVWELLWPVITGSRLVFAKPGLQKDVSYLKSLIVKESITLLHFVPPMLDSFLEEADASELPGLKKIICSGEALRASTVELFKEKFASTELHNLYGPTEASIDVSYWSLDASSYEPGRSIPIGRPVANTQLHILDQEKQLCPVGVIGELHIGGVQLARGYLGNEELTRAKFVSNPFKEGGRLYKTGDLARWLPDGNIDFMGRKDDQVKVRGYRIELGEIESVLRVQPGIRQGVVLAREDNRGVKRLVGYVVTDGELDKAGLKAGLGKTLPEYMVPELWVVLEELPLTGNGKIDRKALPDPDAFEHGSKAYVAPRNETEIKLAQICAGLLGLEKVSIQDDFFALGGHSLLATRLVSQIRSQLNVELPMKDIFDYSPLEELALHIEIRLKHMAQQENDKAYLLNIEI